MKTRCLNKNHVAYDAYGGAGVKICKRWRSFVLFLADMGERPSRGHTLDRFPNREGNYEPGNARWATSSEQNINRRMAHVLEMGGLSMTMTEWSRKLGVRVSTISERLRHGWSVRQALSRPVRPRARPRARRAEWTPSR
jgi:hypothetical protein